MNTNANIVATFTDRFGEERKIHATRNGMTVKRRADTHCQVLGKAISGYVGERIRAIRQRKEMTMEELGLRAGLTTGSNLKQRVYELEHNQRGSGMRFGTVYQIAIALEVEITEDDRREAIELCRARPWLRSDERPETNRHRPLVAEEKPARVERTHHDMVGRAEGQLPSRPWVAGGFCNGLLAEVVSVR